ncbi:hypothetical protein KP509_18G060800 [Ceratopteris richardii]|uniref:Uncharacterized protein n=1 Tax=Ceratopteris richardii TaxID=49495 RepID=A0A8T2SS79_CERRI|nr:hypothetical protein KP509_18G060800 [Ceratopteris richardii]
MTTMDEGTLSRLFMKKCFLVKAKVDCLRVGAMAVSRLSILQQSLRSSYALAHQDSGFGILCQTR